MLLNIADDVIAKFSKSLLYKFVISRSSSLERETAATSYREQLTTMSQAQEIRPSAGTASTFESHRLSVYPSGKKLETNKPKDIIISDPDDECDCPSTSYTLGFRQDVDMTVSSYGIDLRRKSDVKKSVEFDLNRFVKFFFKSLWSYIAWKIIFFNVLYNFHFFCFKYIFLSVCVFRWAKLKPLLAEIDEEAKELSRGTRKVCYRRHIGDGFFASVNSGWDCVDFRKWYLPYGTVPGDEKPTKSGLALNLEEWRDFLSVISVVEMKYTKLATTIPCDAQADHMSQRVYFACMSCNPFP